MIKPPRAEVSPRKDSQCGPSVDSRSALAHSRTVRAVFPRLFMLVAVATASCTMMVDRPKTFTGDERVTGIGYSAAVDYLNDTNKLFQKRLKSLDSFDLTSKGGVGLGVGGAGISAVFRSGIDTILGFVTFGALNYATNQLIDPKSLGDVFSAGLSNLDCIDAAGAVAFQTTNAIRPTLPDIRSRLGAAIAGLQRDKALAGNNSIYAADITAADASIGPANKAAATIDSYYSGSNVGEAMVAAINATITAVNQQVRAKSPNIDSIAQSGAIFSSFINANTNLRAQTQTAIQQASKGFVAQGAADVHRDSLQQQFDADKAMLKNVIASIPALDVSNITNIASCKTQFAAEAPVTVQPAGTVNLTAGGAAVTLNVTGKAPVRVQWDGANPSASDVQVNTNLSQITFTATATAKASNYSFEAIDFSGKSSGAIQIDVAAAASKPPPAPSPAHVAVKPPPAPAPIAAKPPATAPVGPPPPPANH